VLAKIASCVDTLKGYGRDSQDNPAALLKGLQETGKIVADRTVTGPEAKTSIGDGLKGSDITLGVKFFDKNETGTYTSFNSGNYYYSISLTPKQARVWAVLHELGHKTGRFASDLTSSIQDLNNKVVIHNCIKPAIKIGII
jgi:hypothetical protein